MTEPTVRQIREEELPLFVESITTAFLERPDVQKVADELKPLWDLQRTWAAFDGDRLCGTFRSFATELTMPGGARLPAAAISGVTVLPTHRRRGILRSMAGTGHAAARERGEAVAVLYASEYPIYGRFGYGPATRSATWTLDAMSSTFHRGTSGSMELVTANDDVLAAVKSVFDAWRSRQAGEIRRRDYRWEYDLGLRSTAWGTDWKGFVILHRDAAGSVDGYARYRAEDKWENRQPRNVLKLDELHALTADAYQALWRFLAEIDMVATIRAEGRPTTERLPWLLTNSRAAVASELGDALWVRLLDVSRSLAGRSYERQASIVLEVVDRQANGGSMRLLLDATPDGASCSPTDRSADLTLDVAALGAALLGGTRLRDAVAADGADEHRGGVLDEADALFRTADEPWCSTFF